MHSLLVSYVGFFLMWLQLQSKYPEFLWREKGTDGTLICSIKIRRLCWRFVILEHGMVNSEGYLLFFLFFNTQWWFLFLQKKGILCLCAQLPIAEQLPFIPIFCMPFPPGKKNLRMIVATHSLKSTHIFKQRNKQKIDPVNTNLCSIPMSLKLHVRSVSYLAIHKRWKSETM